MFGLEIEERNHTWFQQDGAIPRSARAILPMQWLREHFVKDTSAVEQFIIGLPIIYYSDIIPLDFHLLGNLKDKLCGNIFENTHHLKTVITHGIAEIPKEHGQKVIEHFVLRVQT